jgi:pilus assembly protein CpaC
VPSAPPASFFGGGATGAIIFNYFINALETNNLLRMLAEPDLVTTSGQTATFLAGGSIPYPVPQTGTGGGSTITIQWQDYGVNLKFTPIVLGNGRIRIQVAPEVSELDYAHAVTLAGTSIPALTKRNVNTTVELAEGQTFTIAGLLQDNITATNQQFPVLGDIPVLGALFRSVNYQRAETELVVMVTPVLVSGVDPADVTEIPGGRWRDPKNLNLYLFKDLGGEVVDAPQAPPANGPVPRFHGEVGFEPPAGPK